MGKNRVRILSVTWLAPSGGVVKLLLHFIHHICRLSIYLYLGSSWPLPPPSNAYCIMDQPDPMFWFDQAHENEERRRIGQILISKMDPGLYLFIANDLWYNLENPPRVPRLTLAVVLHLFLSLQ
jgi:hypothetical protein